VHQLRRDERREVNETEDVCVREAHGLDAREDEEGEVVDVVFEGGCGCYAEYGFDVLGYAHHGCIDRADPGRHRWAVRRFVFHELVEDAVRTSGVRDAPERLLAFAESQPGEVVWLGGLEGPDFVHLVGVDIPE